MKSPRLLVVAVSAVLIAGCGGSDSVSYTPDSTDAGISADVSVEGSIDGAPETDGGMCEVACKVSADCTAGCGAAAGTWCCDAKTQRCFVPTVPVCPAADGGMMPPPY